MADMIKWLILIVYVAGFPFAWLIATVILLRLNRQVGSEWNQSLLNDVFITSIGAALALFWPITGSTYLVYRTATTIINDSDDEERG